MRTTLTVIFSLFFLIMLAFTVRASLDRSILDVGWAIVGDAWFQATLVDAYLGFFTFYVWVAYKERTWVGRIVWFVLIMALGNMAMATYVLIQLARLGSDGGVEQLLLRRAAK
ncbi:MAG: DUF1475 domain-containing protein [Planctomycetota bacterium]|nr:MAG: DUF1475 domain-containing protein [Planctomycetota bacterium]REK26328.1 MAG: DUF1475 domain-containing protein [Planctomycetota bacterium]REK45879.1 MAG: DUF1475 domain-containing protein [Planctomycetota bacterium]